MAPELHLHPHRLRAHAATAAALSEDLRGALPVPAGEPAQAGDAAAVERERLYTEVQRAVRELAELSAILAGVAAAAVAADDEAVRALGRAQGSP